MAGNPEISDTEQSLANASEGELGEDQPDASLPQEEL